MRPFLAALAVLALFAVPARAQQPTFHDPLLDHMVGRWVLRGTIGGQTTTHDVTAEWVLAHQLVRLHEESREKKPTGEPAYEAMVFIGWDQPASAYACLWLDDFGGIYPSSIARAKRVGDELPFVFTLPDSSTFHTTFAYDSTAVAWTWRMDAEQHGTLQPFARVTLTRR